MTSPEYGEPPVYLGSFDFDLSEVMYYLYLPVMMRSAPDRRGVLQSGIRLPRNLSCLFPLVDSAIQVTPRTYKYAYVSARKGWATPDNPLNRPGWHCDGFGTDDMNFVWWSGPGTRFAIQEFADISTDHVRSLSQFDAQIKLGCIVNYPERCLFGLNPFVVHATPLIDPPGCMRQFVKISLSDERYNLENNSHNYLFDYDWPMSPREQVRNDTFKAQRDFDGSAA